MSKVVKEVFEKVSGHYDLMNDLMSFGLHRCWKKTLIKRLNPQPNQKLLDLAGGTGDIAIAFLDAGGGSAILSDINEKMLAAGEKKRLDQGLFNKYQNKLELLVANAEELPLPDESFERVTMVFGIRNVSSVDKVLSEVFRVLKKDGQFFCMEFVRPEESGLRRKLYDLYSYQVIPLLGKIIVGDSGPYKYLVDSIRNFLPTRELLEKMRGVGFQEVTEEVIIKDLVSLYSCKK
jgi:demethylmenaquinone methyltransferase/2-methoxy-6-polyprenyl-1,4-benzoquinol methylase